MIAATIRIALLFYFLSCVLRLSSWPGTWPPNSRRQAARAFWTLAWFVFVLHVLAAFALYHHWDHAHAVAHTREVSGVGWGIYVSYVFTAVWGLDVALWWLVTKRWAAQPRWVQLALHAFMAFMIFNGTVVYEKGPIVWAGAFMFLVLGLLVAGRLGRGR